MEGDDLLLAGIFMLSARSSCVFKLHLRLVAVCRGRQYLEDVGLAVGPPSVCRCAQGGTARSLNLLQETEDRSWSS